MGELTKITRPDFGEQTFINGFEAWEVHLKENEMQAENGLPDHIKFAALIMGSKGKLQEHLLLRVSELTTYEKFRDAATKFHTTKDDFKDDGKTTRKEDDGGLAPMDIGLAKGMMNGLGKAKGLGT